MASEVARELSRSAAYAPTTRFGAYAVVPVDRFFPAYYADFARPVLESFATPGPSAREEDVADAIRAAAHDITGQLRFLAGPDAVALAEVR